MYRNFLTGLCAVALVATGLSAVQAQTETVDVSLNLRYNDPADPSEGGTWELVGKVDSGLGIAAVNAIIADIDNGVAPDDITLGSGIGALDPIDPGGANERPAYLVFGTVTDLLYGQDISAGSTTSVGLGVGTPGDNGADSLLNSTWDNAALLASGTFSSGTRPTFSTTPSSSSTDSNILNSLAPVSAASPLATTTIVRGDSESSLALEAVGTGLFTGDSNRDGFVDGLDFNLFLPNFGAAGAFGWDDGDWDDSSTVDGLDFNLFLPNFGTTAFVAPLVGASSIPEPSTFVVAAILSISVAGMRRRKLSV